MVSWYSNLCRSIFTRIFSLLSITGYGEIYEVSRISRSQAEVVDNTNTLAQRRAVMTARTFYQCGQCLNLRSCTMILALSLLLVLVPFLKREVFLRLLSIFILLRNQYVLIQIRCRMLDIESHLGCTTSFFKIISTSFSKRKVFFSGKYSLKTVNDPPVSFLSFPFSYSPNRLRRDKVD